MGAMQLCRTVLLLRGGARVEDVAHCPVNRADRSVPSEARTYHPRLPMRKPPRGQFRRGGAASLTIV